MLFDFKSSPEAQSDIIHVYSENAPRNAYLSIF